jgi:hypothetical protein
MIDISVRLLLERIASPEIEPTITFVPGKLVQRQSARVALAGGARQ